MTEDVLVPADDGSIAARSGSGTRLCHVRLASRTPALAASFFTEQFGLRAGVTPAQAVLGLGDRAHSIAFANEQGDRVGIELTTQAALERLAAGLAGVGLPATPMSDAACAARACRAGVETTDASGNRIELVVRPGHLGAPPTPDQCGGLTGLESVALRSTDVEADSRIWTDLLGAVVADRAGDIVYLAQDAAHHRIALYPSSKNGVLYTGIGLNAFDQLMQTYYALQARQIDAVHGPGKEAASGQYFLRFMTPEGHMMSLVQGGNTSQSAPRQFLAQASSLCALGSVCEKVPELSFPTPGPAARQRRGS